MLRKVFKMGIISAAACLTAGAALAADGEVPVTETEDVPDIMIVRIPSVGESTAMQDQSVDSEVEVFPLKIRFKRLDDGTLDKEDLRAQVLDLMQRTEPVVVKVGEPDPTIASLPIELQEKFKEAESDSVATFEEGAKRVVAWRGYGPVRGYNRGVVAFNSGRYRGYYPYLKNTRYWGYNPYYGYYANRRNYPFTYGVYRTSPSYRYYGYYRHW